MADILSLFAGTGVNIALLFISAAVATPFWLLLAQRLGKFEAWILFNVLSTVTNLLFLLPREGQTGMVMVGLLDPPPPPLLPSFLPSFGLSLIYERNFSLTRVTAVLQIVMFINGLPGGGIFLNNSIMVCSL